MSMMEPNRLSAGSKFHRAGVTIRKDVLWQYYTLILTVAACVFSNIGISPICWLLVGAFALLILRPENLIGPIFFFTACDDFLLVTESVTFSRFCVLFFIAGVVLHMLMSKTNVKHGTVFPLIIMVMAIILSQYTIYNYTSFPVMFVLNILLTVAMVNYTQVSCENIIKQLYTYCVVAILYVAYMLFSNGLDSLADGVRLTFSEDANSNQVAMGLAGVLVFLVCNVLIFDKNKVINVILALLTCVALFLTGSRSALLASAITAFLLIMVSVKDKKSRWKVCGVVLLSAAGVVLVYLYLQKQFPLLMARFTIDSVAESGGTGRVEVWTAFFRDYFPDHWLIGIGHNPLNMYYAALYSNGEGHGAHNIIVEILSGSGVLGLAMYIAYFTGYFKRAFTYLRTNKFVLYSLAIVTVTIVNGMGENTLSARLLWYGIGLAYVISYGSKRDSSIS